VAANEDAKVARRDVAAGLLTGHVDAEVLFEADLVVDGLVVEVHACLYVMCRKACDLFLVDVYDLVSWGIRRGIKIT